MKSKTILFIALLFSFQLIAQSNSINYKALVKDNLGNVLSSELINVRLSILEGATIVYQEQYTQSTDVNGIIILNIGEGSVTIGTYNTIDWSLGSQSLKTEISLPGFGWVDLGTTDFKSVPYALHALSADNAAFKTEAAVTSNTNLTDDFVFGSPQLDDDGDTAHDKRMFFDKSKGAFRAGTTVSTEWDDANVGANSTALGFRSIASGEDSFSTGYLNVSSGDGANSFGVRNTGSGGRSTAFGSDNIASGFISTAMGGNTVASGNSSTAMGVGTEASGYASTSMGHLTLAKSYGQTTIGINGTNSETPISIDTYDANDRLFVIGNGVDSSNRNDALVMLKNGNTTLNGHLTLNGRLQGDLTVAGILTIRHPSGFDIIFPTGNSGVPNSFLIDKFGTGDLEWQTLQNVTGTTNFVSKFSGVTNSPLTNSLIYDDGTNVGIGTNLPENKLDVVDAKSSGYVAKIENTSPGIAGGVLALRLNSQTPLDTNYFVNFLGSGGSRGKVNGSPTGVNYATTSDRRLKQHISDTENALALISKMQPRTYEFKATPDIEEYGFIAQELQLLYPQAVIGSPNSDVKIDPMMVDYSRLTPLLTAGIKELQKEVEDLKEKNNKLTQQLSKYESLEARLSALENPDNDNIANNIIQD